MSIEHGNGELKYLKRWFKKWLIQTFNYGSINRYSNKSKSRMSRRIRETSVYNYNIFLLSRFHLKSN